MKAATELIEMWKRGELDEPLEDVLHAYGELVKQECAGIAENHQSINWIGKDIAAAIKELKLP